MSADEPGVLHAGARHVRPEVRALRAYRLGQASALPAHPVRLHQNEAAGDWPEAVKHEVAARLVAEPWHRYPSARAEGVCRALGDLQGTPPEMVLPAAGSNEALWGAFAAFAARGTVVMPAPTYSMARTLAVTAGAQVIEVPLAPGFALDATAVLRAAHAHRAEAIYLASPNNPTGNALDPEALRQVIEGAPGVVVLDEAYWEFARAPWLGAVARYPHLVLVRTFSKAMAGAALRLGWLTGQREVIEELTKVMPPYALNIFTQVAAPVLVAHRHLALARVHEVSSERERVADRLAALGVRAYSSETNFLLFEPGLPAAAVWEGLAARGVLIRDVSSQPHLAGCLRVTIGSRADNDRFLAALRAVLDDFKEDRS
jgi:histidinol-phosphate aminotransferase